MSWGLVSLPYQRKDIEVLEGLAKRILPSNTLIPSGHAGRRAEFLAGRAALALACEAVGYQGMVKPNPEFGYLETFPRGPYVNLSHTEGLAVAVAAPTPIGVDVERDTRHAERVMGRVATEGERAMLQGAPIEIEGKVAPLAVALWSAKEAVSKATGLGIKFGMQRFQIALQPPLCPVRLGVTGPLPLEEPRVCFFREAGYVIAVCSEARTLCSEPHRVRK